MKFVAILVLVVISYVNCKPFPSLDVLKDQIGKLKEKVYYVKDHPEAARGNDNPDALLTEIKRLKDEVLEEKAAELKDAEAVKEAPPIPLTYDEDSDDESDDDSMKDQREIPVKKDEVPVKKVEVPEKKDETPAKKVEVPEKKDETPAKKDEVITAEEVKEVPNDVNDEVANYRDEIAAMRAVLKDPNNLKDKKFLSMLRDEASHLKADILAKIDGIKEKDAPKIAPAPEPKEEENENDMKVPEVPASPSHDEEVQEKLASIKRRLDTVREKIAANPEALKDQALKDQVVSKLKEIKMKLVQYKRDEESNEEETKEEITQEDETEEDAAKEEAKDMKVMEGQKMAEIKSKLDAIRTHLLANPLKDEQLKREVELKLRAIHSKLLDVRQRLTGEEIIKAVAPPTEKKDEAPKPAPMTKDVMKDVRQKLDHIKQELKDNPIQDDALRGMVLEKLHLIHSKLEDAVQVERDAEAERETAEMDEELDGDEIKRKEEAEKDEAAESPEKLTSEEEEIKEQDAVFAAEAREAEAQKEADEAAESPAKKDEKPEPVKKDEKPEPVKKDEKPEPVKKDEKPEPVKKDEKPEPVKKDEKPEPVKKDEAPKEEAKDAIAEKKEVLEERLSALKDELSALKKDYRNLEKAAVVQKKDSTREKREANDVITDWEKELEAIRDE